MDNSAERAARWPNVACVTTPARPEPEPCAAFEPAVSETAAFETAAFEAAVLVLLEELASAAPDTGDAGSQECLEEALGRACRVVASWL